MLSDKWLPKYRLLENFNTKILVFGDVQYNLSNPACYQTEKKIRIRQGTGIERLTYPRDIKVTLVSIGIQHRVDNGYVNELYTQIYSRLNF